MNCWRRRKPPSHVLWLDGGGVIPDQPLATDTRLRIRLTDNPAEDVTVCVEGGQLHILGQYATLHVHHVQANHVSIQPALPHAG